MTHLVWTVEDRIRAFKEVREFTKYNYKLRTKVYTEEDLENLDIVSTDDYFKYEVCRDNEFNLMDKSVDVNKYVGTVEALKDCRDEYVAILNFADGYTPGGLVLNGATTQEESLCRSSNLYESLIDPICKEKYYDYNFNNKEFKFGKSSDRIIYTKNVTFFRQDDFYAAWDGEGFTRQCDVITCPAPMAGTATDDEIRRRMRNIINVADDNRINTLILGCWGCGAFGNSWEHFSELWFEVIRKLKPNCKILFATYGNGTRLDVVFGSLHEGKIDPRTEDEALEWMIDRVYGEDLPIEDDEELDEDDIDMEGQQEMLDWIDEVYEQDHKGEI